MSRNTYDIDPNEFLPDWMGKEEVVSRDYGMAFPYPVNEPVVHPIQSVKQENLTPDDYENNVRNDLFFDPNGMDYAPMESCEYENQYAFYDILKEKYGHVLEEGEIRSSSHENAYDHYDIENEQFSCSREPGIDMRNYHGVPSMDASKSSPSSREGTGSIHFANDPESPPPERGRYTNDYEFPVFPRCVGKPKPIKRIAEPESANFRSPQEGWKRVFQKYSPSTEVLHSPVKHAEANLMPSVATDLHLYGQVWIVSMTEQLYFDNSIILLHKYNDVPEELKYAMRMNFQTVDAVGIAEGMVDLNILGSGSFGDVYRARKADTDDFFAIKFLKHAPKNDFREHTESLLEYLKEKNNLIKARSSPYVVQFFYSVKFPGVNGLFLFFEWCICDLRKYSNIVSFSGSTSSITNQIWLGVEDGFSDILLGVYSSFDDDLYKATLVYIFEVFCSLDFLAKCNVVHQDLKPENIMISTNLHLKIGDFGLVYNTKFITRPSQIHLVEADTINYLESTNYKPVFGGTPNYEDMEIVHRYLLQRNKQAVRELNSSIDLLDFRLPTDPVDANPDFLSDLWSCGIIATELLFGGIHILNPAYFSFPTRYEMGLSDDFRVALLQITYRKRNYKQLIQEGFVKFGGEENVELMKFLASIFRPRRVRALDFVSKKTIYRYKQKVTLKHIDIKKVEKISVFEDMGLNDNNSFLFELPKGLHQLLGQTFHPEYRNMHHLLKNIIKKEKDTFFNLEPGIQSCYL